MTDNIVVSTLAAHYGRAGDTSDFIEYMLRENKEVLEQLQEDVNTRRGPLYEAEAYEEALLIAFDMHKQRFVPKNRLFDAYIKQHISHHNYLDFFNHS